MAMVELLNRAKDGSSVNSNTAHVMDMEKCIMLMVKWKKECGLIMFSTDTKNETFILSRLYMPK